MKAKTIKIVFMIFTMLALENRYCFSQGFINLDFEEAVIVPDSSNPYSPNAVYASDAIPGWTPTGFTGPTWVLYNTASAGSTSVSILGTSGFPPALDGLFSVYLYGGGTAASASISQTGLVPVGTESLLFEAQQFGAGTLQVFLGNQNISFSALSTGANYTLYGGNIPLAFAGQSEQLMFSALEGENFWNIDDIQFSSTAVPEPNEFALGTLGALLLGLRRWRNSSVDL
jgi:hypothetical protein